ncbi:MAG: TonB-dependent receptor [Acidobacteria bacterium]|nr:TonB-dependent receptor [Acidobacteriota bacterium]
MSSYLVRAIILIRSIAVLLIALAAPAVAAAQPAACTGSTGGEAVAMRGRVLDPTQAAVTDAVVLAECAGTVFETATDGEGRFVLEIDPGSYNLHVQKPGFSPGYQVVRVGAAPANLADIQLDVATFTDVVTVTAGGFEQAVRHAPASVSVLPAEELATKRFASLAQALVDVEGVDVGQDVGKTGGLTISMRGMPADYTLMLIDGRRQNPAGSVTPNGFGETATSFMPPMGAIERIEVVRGPMSTLYGSDAMGGVVNVITRKVGTRWTGSLATDGTLQGNSDYGNTGQVNAYLTGPVVANMLGVAVRGSVFRREAAALRYETVNGEQVPITAFGLSPTRGDIRTAGGRVTYLPRRNHEIYADVDMAWQAYDNSERQLGTVGVQGGYAEELKFNRQQFLVAHAGRFSFGLLDSSITRNTTETIGRTIPPGTPGRVAGDPRTLEATNTIIDSKLVTALGRHTLSVGGQWWDAHMVDAVAPLPYDHGQGALYAEDEWRLARLLSMTLGARYDRHSTFGGHLSPRAYLVFNPSRIFTIKGGISRGFRTPQLNQLAEGITGFGGQGTIPLIGSPGLKPETSTSTELSAWMNHGPVQANVTVFNNEFQDKIASGPGLENCSFRLSPDRPGCADYGNWPNVDLFGQQINVDEAVTRGVEASLRLSFLNRWNLMHNYTYTESEQRSGTQAGQPLVNTPKHMFNANLRYAATSRLNTWVRVEARSSRTRGTSAAAVAATQQIGSFKAYGLAHLGAGYKVTEGLTLNATVYNLLDTDFLSYEPYVLNNVTSYASRYNNLQEPRRLWLSAAYSF